MTGFKAPKAVIVVDELPKTSTGKVRKNVLRKQFADFYQHPSSGDATGGGPAT